MRRETPEGDLRETLFDPNNSQVWSQQTTEYAPDGHVTTAQTVNDNGTYTLQTNDPDGSHAVTTSAVDGADPAAATTQHYDAAGHLVSETTHNDDGSTTLVTHDAAGAHAWDTQTALFDQNNNLRLETIQYDDGWSSVRLNDLDGAQPWSAAYTVYNPAGQFAWQDILSDSGGGTEYGLNRSGSGDWTSYLATFQNGWQETSETDVYNDGSRAELTIDTTGQAFDYTANWYDAANHLTYQDTVYDDGSATETGYNVSGAGDWTAYTASYDAAGHETHETDYYTDGTRAEVSFDLSGQSWDTRIDWYDGAGQLMLQDVNYDNGTSTETYYDTTGQDWSSWVANYDAAGNEVSETDYWDNGWRSEYVWNGSSYNGYDYTPAGQLYDTFSGSGGESPEGFIDQDPVDFYGGDAGFYDGGFDFGDFPVVLDLDGNGVDIALRGASTAAFDFFAFSPGREATTWIAGNDGLLAIDLAANGQAGADGVIDQAKEIVFTRWANAGSDMAALRAMFDTNHNDRLDPGDARWGEFRVWRDQNRNGTSESGELQTLTQMGIAFLALTTSGAPLAFADGSAVNGLASYTLTNGTTRLAADATFAPAGDISADAAHTNALVNVRFDTGGATVSEITERDGAGNLLDHRITTIAGNAITVQADTNGDGRIDRLETSSLDVLGIKTVEQKELGLDGSVLVAVKTQYESGGTLAQLKTITVSDAANVQTWSTRVSTYDAAGDLAFVAVANDDGSQIAAAFGATDTFLAGSAFADTLTGAAGNDMLDGGSGADTMAGGAGDDAYFVDDAGDHVIESAAAGYDTIVSEADYTLPANVEQLTLIGSGDLDAVANALDDTLVGNTGANQFTVGPGADRIIGHLGIDTVVFSGNFANYAILFDGTDTQTFTVTDLRTGSPDGINTISGVELFKFADTTVDTFSFATQSVNNPDGTRTVTARDVTGDLPWAARISTYDAANHLMSERFEEDNGAVWTNSYDTGNAGWSWKTSNHDGYGNLISQTTAYDDGTHALEGHDAASAGDWADFVIAFDADWNIVTQNGTRDDGTALTAAEIAAAAETVAWYTHVVDPARDLILS